MRTAPTNIAAQNMTADVSVAANMPPLQLTCALRNVSTFGVPGDTLLDDGALAFGPHHQQPPCRHYPECGGCQLQHADDEAYRGYLVSRVETALAQHDLTATIRPASLSPPNSLWSRFGRAKSGSWPIEASAVNWSPS